MTLKVNTEISISNIITIVTLLVAFTAGYTRLSTRVESVEKTLDIRAQSGTTYYDRLKQTDDRVVRVEVRQDNLEDLFKTSLKKIDDNMQRMADSLNVKIVN